MAATMQQMEADFMKVTLLPNEHPHLLNFEAEILFAANARPAKIIVSGILVRKEGLTLEQIHEGILDVVRAGVGSSQVG